MANVTMLKPFSSRFFVFASAGHRCKASKTRQDRRTGAWQLSSDSWIDNENPDHGCYCKGEGLNITETGNKQVIDVSSICEPVVGRVKRGISAAIGCNSFRP